MQKKNDSQPYLKHISTKVIQLARVLAKRRLSPNRKQLVIDQLLKYKYHATHWGYAQTHNYTQ